MKKKAIFILVLSCISLCLFVTCSRSKLSQTGNGRKGVSISTHKFETIEEEIKWLQAEAEVFIPKFNKNSINK